MRDIVPAVGTGCPSGGLRHWRRPRPRRRPARSRRTSRASSVASARAISAWIAPSCSTRIRSDIARTSGRSLEMRMIASPDAASSEMIRWTSTLAPMSMPRVGSSRMSTRGSVASHFARTTFCWLPPDRAPTSWSTPVARIRSWSTYRAPSARSSRSLDEQPRKQPPEDRQAHVRGDREVEHEPVLMTILGHVGDARGERLGRAREADGRAGEADLAGVARGRCRTARGRSPSGRRRSGRPMPRISPARTRERDVPERVAAGEAVDLEQHVTDRGLDLRKQRDRPADHVPHEVGGRHAPRSAP